MTRGRTVAAPEPSRFLGVYGANNLREMGGFAVGGGQLRWKRLLRSGDTNALDAEAIAALRAYGLTHVIDLRSAPSHPRQTDPFARVWGVRWRNVPIAVGMEAYAKDAPEYEEFGPFAGGYLVLLRNQRGVRAVFRHLARAARADGCALFHCTGGMDRTGAIAMLLMGLAEAPRESLLLDFGYSFASVDTVERLVREGATNEADEALAELIESIDIVRNALTKRHGSVRGYLEACGVSARDLDVILRWMVARSR